MLFDPAQTAAMAVLVIVWCASYAFRNRRRPTDKANHHPRPRSRPGHQPTGGSRMRHYPMSPQRAEDARILAAELLNEANARGDLDWEAVTWAVGYLMRRANTVGPIETNQADPTRTVHPAGAADTHTTGAGA